MDMETLDKMDDEMEKQTKVQIGDVFGRWTVIGSYELGRKNERKWVCRCECGTERYVLERSLLYGGSKSCGCLKQERAKEVVSHDLLGKCFGELTVLKAVLPRDKRRGVWWQCRCTCGRIVEMPGTLLVTGRRTHCGCKTEKHYAYRDVTGQRFNRLTALFPLDERDAKGSVMWRCRCDCGNEVDVPYNNLAYSDMKSCGCQKKEHDQMLGELLTHVAGTSIDHLRSKKLPKNSSTGVKGVYLIRGKYQAKIVFQQKQYWLGAYSTLEDAAEARKEAEESINDQVTAFYAKWKAKADANKEWAAQNPIHIEVEKKGARLEVILLPKI